MTWVLDKLSLPNDWAKTFETKDEAIDELRSHICGNCLRADEYENTPPVDVTHDGRLFECRDVSALLSTGCGLEYDLEEVP